MIDSKKFEQFFSDCWLLRAWTLESLGQRAVWGGVDRRLRQEMWSRAIEACISLGAAEPRARRWKITRPMKSRRPPENLRTFDALKGRVSGRPFRTVRRAWSRKIRGSG